jgi:hypothetical protein
MRVVVTGLVATYPVGGVAWDYLQYVEGFRRLGCDVFYVEDTGQWFYDPDARTFVTDATTARATWPTRCRRSRPGSATPGASARPTASCTGGTWPPCAARARAPISS